MNFVVAGVADADDIGAFVSGRLSSSSDRVTGEGDSAEERQLSREKRTVASHQAVRGGGRVHGPGPSARRRSQLPLPPRPRRAALTATTHDVGNLDYETNKAVLDHMIQSLKLDGS